MRLRLLAYLACPVCEGDLDLRAGRHEGDHVMEGSLVCGSCRATYPVRRGVPRMALAVDDIEKRAAQAFGDEWTRYSELAERYRRQFLDWIRPVDTGFFPGKTVLEAGCGKGRHTWLAASFGAEDVVALDLGHAVDVAFTNTRDLANAHVVQADLKRPPLKQAFDYAFSVGVLHHLPDPEEGFRSLVSRVKPGGSVSAWVYGREGNGWIVHVVSPLRERITSKMPRGLLDVIAAILALPLLLATRLVYGPTNGRLLGAPLPYGPYLAYIASFPYREQRSIVFDHLVAPIAHYVARDDFAGWFRRAGLKPAIEHHNANSWRGFATVPSAQAAGPVRCTRGPSVDSAG